MRATSADTLVGLWGTEHIVTPTVGGTLTIDGRASAWRAEIGGFNATVERTMEKVSFTLSGGAGEFRGHRSDDAKTIIGHWIQPAGFNPYNQRYASPVELTTVSENVWRGIVSPLEHRISFYISIQQRSDGVLSAFIRNPEANYFAGRGYTVSLEGDSVTFSNPAVPEAGTYDRESDRLFVPLLFMYPPLAFTRRTESSATGFSPRAASDPRLSYVYRPPIAEDDGWQVASVEDAGMSKHAVAGSVQKILESAPSPLNPLNIQSLLIARHGKLVLEEYFYGFGKERTHDMRSASKTITSLLVGIAHDRGHKIGAETPVYSLFPEYTSFANWDERKGRITVGDLLNMTSGLAINDADPASPGNESTMQSQTAQPDWFKYTLDLPMAHDPGGEHPIYGSANTNLAGGAVRNATGTWLPEFFYEYVARPLQIKTYHMNLMPAGEAYAGGGLYMRPRDQLKLGQLYLDGGMWNGRVVVSKEWVEQSAVSRGILDPRMESDTNHGYGSAWHFRSCQIATAEGQRGEVTYYWAGGNGGQYIIVVPEYDMVVGFTGGDYTEFRKYLRWEIEFLKTLIAESEMR